MINFRSLTTAALLGISALTLTATSVSATAPCRNAKGQFTKCTGAAAVASPRKQATRTAVKRTSTAAASKSAAKPATRTAAKSARKAATAAHPTG